MGLARDDAGKVVSLMAGKNVTPPPFAQMEAYWQALRPDTGALPRRADFDPRGVAGLLHATLLLERIAPGQVRIRLAGMALCDLLGMDLRGMPLSALVIPESRERLATAMERVFDGPARAHLRLAGERGMMRPTFSGDLLVLPMLGHSGAADRALACLVTAGNMGRAPRRLEVTQDQMLPIAGLPAAPRPVVIRPSAPPPAPMPARPRQPETQGMAEAPAQFAPARPYLRLVRNDD